jgi:hypothetical protein
VARRGATARRRQASPQVRRRKAANIGAALSPLKLALYLVYLAIFLAGANFLYQVIRKPTELFFPVSGVLYKTPAETWHAYAELFRRYATVHVSAPLLAALAQVEASGNPLVRTYWRWAWPALPFDFYRPASSAVGMYQITDPTFAEARHYCIHEHRLTREGPWNDWHSCWFNGLYLRVVPRDAVELTAADLELKVTGILEQVRAAPSGAQLQHLAAVVHLCGAGAAATYARRGFRFSPGQHCGDQDPREYLERVDGYSREFARLAARGEADVSQ